MKRRKEVTLRDIADELQLTVHTVSKALRGLPGMSERTRTVVFETARRMGYRTKEQELSLWYERIPKLTTASRRFVFILTENTPFYRLQMDGLQDRLQELGHSLSASFLSSRIAGRRELEEWMTTSDLLYADGVVIPPAIPDEVEDLLLDIPLPKVLINYPPPLVQADSVIWDVEQAIHQSVRHFVSMGHTRILYIGDTSAFRGFRLRWSAFCAAMHGAGLTVDPEEHLTAPARSSSEWERQLEERLLGSDRTAILCAVESYLNPLIYFLQARGKSIPHDYSLIVLENMASPLFPHISRPSLLVREAGRKAAERLLWRIANPDEPYEHIRLSGGFLEGTSVRRLV